MQLMASRSYRRLSADVAVSSYGVIAIGLWVGKAAACGAIRVLPRSRLLFAVGIFALELDRGWLRPGEPR